MINRGKLHWPLEHKRLMVLPLGLGAVILAVVILWLTGSQSTPASFDWRTDWAVEDGFNITVDSEGFLFPTSIAFIPNPGDSPKDPLYFVTELPGRLKVVTNDRSVFTFAEDFFSRRPRRVMPLIDEEVGMAGLCLAPEHGQVFVTFSYHDIDGILRNNVVRFQSTPETFSLAPTSAVGFTEIFDSYPSEQSHQIGPCQVKDDLLYVSVADAGFVGQSQSIDSVLGKVLRMRLDGKPAAGNPFYLDEDIKSARNYVWASGFRNPFGLEIVADRVFVADNGPNVDRFVRLEEGGNYLWDGTNVSIGTNADAVFSPGRGVAHLEYYPPDSDLFPERFRNSFFMTMTSNPLVEREGFPAIWTAPYDLAQGKLSAVPGAVLRFRGGQVQVLSALDFGPDGLYFAPLLPNKSGFNGVYKITYEAETEYPYVLSKTSNPVLLMSTHGCFVCHSLNENRAGTIGPNLDRDALVPRLESRLNSREYAKILREMDELEIEPFAPYGDARQAVDKAQGLEKIRTWLYHRILEPRFDDPNAAMPRLGLSDQQARVIADFLAGASGVATETNQDRNPLSKVTNTVESVADWVQGQLPIPTRTNAKKFLAAFFGVGVGVGIVLGALATTSSYWLFVYRRRKRNDRQP